MKINLSGWALGWAWLTLAPWVWAAPPALADIKTIDVGITAVEKTAQRIEQFRSAQGVEVLFVAARDIPMVDLAIEIDAGSRWDPKGLEGLAGFAASLSAKGLRAVEDRPAIAEEEMGRAMAALAIQRSESVSQDRTSIRYRFLSEASVRQKAVVWAGRHLSEPAFDQQIFERERSRAVSGLKESLTRPQTLATRALWSAMYADHPYGRQPNEAAYQAITAEHVASFHARFWRPERISISLVGDLSLSQAKALVDAVLEPLGARVQSQAHQALAIRTDIAWLSVLPPVAPASAAEIRLPHPANQSHIWLGLPMMSRADRQDFFPMTVANHILGGGGFTARLTQEVREKRGLSYSVFSTFQPLAQTGPFFIGLQTQRDRATEALSVVQSVLNTFVRDGPTQDELEAAKKNLLGGFALRLDSNRKLLDNLAQMAFYRLPIDYLDQWTDRIAAVNQEDIRDALTRRLAVDQMTVVMVGEPAPAAKP
jgi:zinc protease